MQMFIEEAKQNQNEALMLYKINEKIDNNNLKKVTIDSQILLEIWQLLPFADTLSPYCFANVVCFSNNRVYATNRNVAIVKKINHNFNDFFIPACFIDPLLKSAELYTEKKNNKNMFLKFKEDWFLFNCKSNCANEYLNIFEAISPSYIKAYTDFANNSKIIRIKNDSFVMIEINNKKYYILEKYLRLAQLINDNLEFVIISKDKFLFENADESIKIAVVGYTNLED